MEDSRKAVRLAEWTARKDFLEFCQTTQYQETGCEGTKLKTLGPPPTTWIKARMYRREIGERLNYSQRSVLVFFGFPFAAIFWAMFRKRLRRIIRRQLRFNITRHTQQPRPRATRRDRVPPPINFGSDMGTAFNIDSPLPEGKLNFVSSTSLERLSTTETARRKRKKPIPSPAGLAPVTFNLSQFKQQRYLHYCPVCSLKFKTTDELNHHAKTHIPVYCWQCDLKGINHDGKTVVDTPGSMSCLANPVFCHYCGDTFARWMKEDSESEMMETVRLRKSNNGRYSVPLETFHALEPPDREAGDMKGIAPLSKFRASMPLRRSAFLDIVME